MFPPDWRLLRPLTRGCRRCAARTLARQQGGRREACGQRCGELINDALIVAGVAQTIRQSLEAMTAVCIEQDMLPCANREIEAPEQILPADFRYCAFQSVHESQGNVIDLLGDRFMDKIPAETIGVIGQPNEVNTAVLRRGRKVHHRRDQRAHDSFGGQPAALGRNFTIVESLESPLIEHDEQTPIDFADDPLQPSHVYTPGPEVTLLDFVFNGDDFNVTSIFLNITTTPTSSVLFLNATDVIPTSTLFETFGTFFSYKNGIIIAGGNILFSDPISSAPVPAAFPLFASGLGVIGLLVRRKKRKNPSALAA
jgi:hypothetical protein